MHKGNILYLIMKYMINYTYTDKFIRMLILSKLKYIFAQSFAKIIFMYKRKLPLDLSCGIRITMSVIGSKWKPCIIDALRENPKRPSQIHREIPEAVSRVLDQNLRELEEHGVVKKTIYPELPPRSEYKLTELGRSLLPVIDFMEDWGESHRGHFEGVAV